MLIGMASHRSLSRLLVVSLVAALPLSALAEAPPTPAEQKAPAAEPSTKTPKKNSGAKVVTRADMIQTSRTVTRGYYDALVEAKYDVAASFLHPSAIEPLRKRVLEDLEKGPPKKTENTLAVLGVKDLNALRTMSLDDFYVAWAKSSYGKGVQVLARKDLVVDVILDPPSCSMQHHVCKVDLTLRARGADGTKMESPTSVWVLEHDGRWLLTNVPPA